MSPEGEGEERENEASLSLPCGRQKTKLKILLFYRREYVIYFSNLKKVDENDPHSAEDAEGL